MIVGKDSKVIADGREFVEYIEDACGFDADDIIEGITMLLLECGFDSPESHSSDCFARMFYDIAQSYNDECKDKSDGIYGDTYYQAEEELQNIQSELRTEVLNSLRSKSRKGNTKEDIAKRLETIISNMDYIF